MEISIKEMLERLQQKYKKEIKLLDKSVGNVNKIFDVLSEYILDNKQKGYQKLLPYYYLLSKDYNMAWLLFNYLKITFLYIREDYHPYAKKDLESPSIWDMKALSYKEGEEKRLLRNLGSTCFRLTANYDYSLLNELSESKNPDKMDFYDISPEARYRELNEYKNYYTTPISFYKVARLTEIYFRLERIDETEECLFRLRHIASSGEPPNYLMEHPTSRHMSAWSNVYDYWYQARRESNEERRKKLAWTALYWYLELAFRLLGNNKIDALVDFCVGCEIIGEFGLMGEDQENFLRHLKRFTAHASISYCKKMIEDPVQVIPYEERNMPSYEECQKIFRVKLLG